MECRYPECDCSPDAPLDGKCGEEVNMIEFKVKMDRTDSDEGWYVQIWQGEERVLAFDLDNKEAAQDTVFAWIRENTDDL